MKTEYTVYYEGKITVEAESVKDAMSEGYDLLKEANIGQFNIKTVEEDFI